jgi:hypothetical protein
VKKLGPCVLAMTAIALLLSGTALAQNVGDSSYYFVTYYSNNVSGAPDGTVRFINDGEYASDKGSLAADIYVFDDSQEMAACGACWISADGLISEDVKTQLTNNPLTGRIPSRGVIKVISDPWGDPFSPPSGYPGLRGWATHIQRATPTAGTYATTEAPFADSNLSSGEATMLGDLCYFLLEQLGSGQGTITCTQEDHDF